jgi:cytochrome c oxidase subunit II
MAGLVGIALAGCQGTHSTLHPAGQGAADVAWITWVMIFGCLFFMALMSAFWLHAVYRQRREALGYSNRLLLIGGGLVLPLVVILVLLIYGVRSGHSMLPVGSPDLEIRVTAQQWFWRFEYEVANGQRFELIDELHLPLGARVDLHIETGDVIHSFWVPSLGGKLDAIPGRTNTLRLKPTRTGQFGGQCAEFCGARHAHMTFDVTVHEAADFETWLASQAGEAP